MNKLRKTIALLLTLLLVLPLAISAGVAEEEIVITFSSNAVEGNAGRAEVLYDCIRQFEVENPNVKFEMLSAGHDDYQVKIATQIAAGDVADIFEYKGGMLNDVVANGLAMPLNGIFEADAAWFDEYYPGVFNDFTQPDGQNYAFPVEFVFTSLLVYNREIFEELGLGAPAENWEDFLAQCDTIREAGYYPIGMGNKDGWPFESCAFSQFANSITGTEWFLNIKYKKGGAFTDEVFLKALDKVLELRDRQTFNPDINTLEDSMANELFYQRKAAMMIDGSWLVSEMMGGAPQDIQDATEFTFMPKVEGGAGDRLDIAGGAGWGYGISSKLEGEKLEKVLAFMKMFNGAQNAKTSLSKGHFPGAMIADFDPADYDPMVQRYYASIMDVYNEPVQCYSVHLPTNLINVFYSGLQDFWADNVTKEEYADEIQTEYERSNM